MVKEGIMLGHKVSIQGIEVDWAKIEAIEKLPPPTLIKVIWIFFRSCKILQEIHKKLLKNHEAIMYVTWKGCSISVWWEV